MKRLFPTISAAMLPVFLTAFAASPGGTQETALGLASPWSETKGVLVRLISATEGTGKTDEVKLGLHFKMESGWRIYWNNPTGSSYHVSLKTTDSVNVSSVSVAWPAPTPIPVFGHMTLGYQNEVVLPVTARLATPGKKVQLNSEINYLACSDICIPNTVKLSVSVPSGGFAASKHAQLIERFEAVVPVRPRTVSIKFDKIEAETGKKPMLRVVARSMQPFENPGLTVGGPETFEFSRPSVKISDGGRTATFEVPTVMVDDIEPDRLQSKKLTLILSDAGRTVGQEIIVADRPIPTGLFSGLWNQLRNLVR